MLVKAVAVETILPLRHRVLRAELPAETARFEGDDAADTVHFAAFDATETVIGCVTLLHNPQHGATWQLRGMAVEESWRGQGVGAALLRVAEAHADGQPIWCNARTPAAPFYARHGWQPISDIFDVPSAGPHLRMRNIPAP